MVTIGLTMSYLSTLNLDGDMEQYLSKPNYAGGGQGEALLFFGAIIAPVILILCMLGMFQYFSRNKPGISLVTANLVCVGGWLGALLFTYVYHGGF